MSHENFIKVMNKIIKRNFKKSKGGRRGAPPGGPNSFIFMQFLAKIIG